MLRLERTAVRHTNTYVVSETSGLTPLYCLFNKHRVNSSQHDAMKDNPLGGAESLLGVKEDPIRTRSCIIYQW